MEKQKDFGFIKNLLNNIALIRWVKKYSADGLQEKNQAESFDVETDENSICIADTGLVKMFFSSSRFKGKTYISLDIKHIKEVLALVEGDGRLIINDSEEKRLCYIQSENNVVVIAPTNESDEKKAKAKNTKKTTKETKSEEKSSKKE